MSEEQKDKNEKCCDDKESCSDNVKSCCYGRGRFLCGALCALLLAAAGFGLFQAGKCAGKQCVDKAAVVAPATETAPVQK